MLEQNLSQYAGESPVRRETLLAQIEYHADKAESVASALGAFIARVRGMPQSDESKMASVPSGHEGQICRLGDALVRLEKLAAELGNIG